MFTAMSSWTYKIVSNRETGEIEYLLPDGSRLSKAEGRKRFPSMAVGGEPSLAGSGDTYRRHQSDALMVHPEQRAEAEDYAKQMGVPTSYGEDGRPKIDSLHHLRKLAKAHGMIDRCGYY